MALLDADGDPHPDIAILCVEELLVASGLNGDTLWRQDLPRPLYGSSALGRFLVTNGRKVVTVAYPEALLTFDAATGQSLWSKRLFDQVYSIALEGDCLAVDIFYGPSSRFSAQSGEPSSCAIAPREEGPARPVAWAAPPRRGASDRDHIVSLDRDEEHLWTASCGPSRCAAKMTPGGVLVESEGPGAQCARILDISMGRVVRVLKPQGAGWSFRSLPPYLVAWRPHQPDASRIGRPVLEIFDATSFETRWRTDPEQPPAVWQRATHCDLSVPDTSERFPTPLPCFDSPDGLCDGGITPRMATGTDDAVFRLRRMGCLGSCPIYEATIFADGRVRYKGSSVGDASDGRIAPDQLEELSGQFREYGFFDMRAPTGEKPIDSPSLYLDFWDGRHVKSLKAHRGSGDDMLALDELAAEVDRVVAIERVLLPPELR